MSAAGLPPRESDRRPENLEPLESCNALEERRRQLIQRLIALQEDERRQVALELHEGAGQMLTSLLLMIKLLEAATSMDEVQRLLPDLKSQTNEALETLRLISVGLRPSLLEDLGLPWTLRSYLRDFGARNQLEVAFEQHGTEVRLGPMTEVTVFRIVQEALTNASKYAQASRVALEMVYTADQLTLCVSDNGVGIDAERLQALADGTGPIGILGMQERATFIGGTCTVDSSPGAGVTVRFHLPLRERPLR